MSDGIIRTIVLPDIHTPLHHKPSINAIFDFISYWKPHKLIQLGDFCDFNSLSSYDLHSPGEFITMQDEIDSANSLLDSFDKALPRNCQKWMIGGNHEDRYHKERAKFLFEDNRVTKAVMTYKLGWADEYRLPKRGWKWVEYGGHLHLDKIIYTHGWASGNGSCNDIARRFPGRNVIFGHTHQHLVSGFMDERGFPIEIESIGTLSNFDLAYLRGKPPYNWTRGFSYIYSMPDGTFTKSFIHIIDGKFVVNGRKFGG